MSTHETPHNNLPLTRRASVRGAASIGIAACAAPLLTACAPVTQQVAPALSTGIAQAPGTANAVRSRVALVRTDDRAGGS